MGPKPKPKEKKGKKKKKTKELTEVELSVLQAVKEQQQKLKLQELAQLRLVAERVNEENKALRDELRQAKRDGADLIAFLRRRLGEKCEEVVGIYEINKLLEKEVLKERENFQKEMSLKKKEYADMCEHLTTDIKTLQTKINNLEEYQGQRDFLLDKNNKLDSYLKTMESRARIVEKEYDKASLIEKNRMRKEMEAKLAKFKTELQLATKVRVAAETRNIINENIARNNELALIIASWQKYHDSKEKLKTENKHLNNQITAQREIKELILKKNKAQSDLIERLTFEHEKICMYHRQGKVLRVKARQMKSQIESDKERLIKAPDELENLRQQNNFLQEKITALGERLKNSQRFKGRDRDLIDKLQKELDAFMNNKTQDEKREAYMLRLGITFNTLFDLFNQDWLLEAKINEVQNVSMDTIIGQTWP